MDPCPCEQLNETAEPMSFRRSSGLAEEVVKEDFFMKMITYTHICHFSFLPCVESEMRPSVAASVRPVVQSFMMYTSLWETYLIIFNNDISKP
jgi:hypothetical protein